MSSGDASPVFVGRDAELAFLEHALDIAAGGTAGTVLVGAEAGVGKSRLISEFAAKARDRALVLIGGCVEVSMDPNARVLRRDRLGGPIREYAQVAQGDRIFSTYRVGDIYYGSRTSCCTRPRYPAPPRAGGGQRGSPSPQAARVRACELSLRGRLRVLPARGYA